jgi:hypothetical protein
MQRENCGSSADHDEANRQRNEKIERRRHAAESATAGLLRDVQANVARHLAKVSTPTGYPTFSGSTTRRSQNTRTSPGVAC